MNRKLLSCLAFVALAFTAGELSAQDPGYVLSTSGGSVGEGGSIDSVATIDTSAGDIVQGWSYGVCHDPAALTLTAAVEGSTTLTVNGGAPAGFLNLSSGLDGYTLGVVIDLFGVNSLAPGSGYELSIGSYDNLMPADQSTDLCFCSTLGTPPVSTVVVVGGASLTPVTTCGTIASIGAVDFIRGDANQDALINIADGVWMLNSLFQGGPSTDCLGANDANADLAFDAADAVYVFNYQFLNGPAPSAPFPGCGGDADPDPSDCASYTACP